MTQHTPELFPVMGLPDELPPVGRHVIRALEE